MSENSHHGQSVTERITESVVASEYGGQRLDIYLSRRFDYLSRSQWQKKLKEGEIFLNGKPVRHHEKVNTGDMVSFSPPSSDEPEIDPFYSVVYDDDFYMGVSKSGNLPVHPSGAYFRNTLTGLLEEDYSRKFFPMHRIDRETSGLVMLGRDSDCASRFQSAFQDVSKKYIAIVRGNPGRENFDVAMPIGPDSDSPVKKKRKAFHGAGESALTKFRLIAGNGNFSVMEASPVTGRTHQIRVHLEYAGLPILGDLIYGGDESLFLELVENGDSSDLRIRAGFVRCALHAYSVLFSHPVTGGEIEISAPLPDDMREFIESEFPELDPAVLLL